MKVKSLSRVRLFGTPWTVVCQAPPSMGFSRQEYWNGLPFPSSRGSSQPRDRTQVSGTASRLFVAQLVKSLLAMWETWVWKISLRREQLPTPVFWSGEFHGLYTVANSRIQLSNFHFHWIKPSQGKSGVKRWRHIWNLVSKYKLCPKVPHLLFSNLNPIQLGFYHLQVRGTN